MILKLLNKSKKVEYKKILQEAFQSGFESYTGCKEEEVLPESHIDACLDNSKCHAYMMIIIISELFPLIMIRKIKPVYILKAKE